MKDGVVEDGVVESGVIESGLWKDDLRGIFCERGMN